MPRTINNNKPWWWSQQILTLFPFSVLYSQLNGIHSKHTLVINMEYPVGMACTHKLSKSLVFVWCSLDLVYSNLMFWCFEIDLHYNRCVTDSENKNMTEYHLESLLPYKTKKNGWHITGVFGDDVLALKTKSNNLHQLETCYTGLQSISIFCCTCHL